MRALIPRVAVLAFLAVSSAGRAQPIWPEGAALTARPVSGGGTISTTFALRWPAAEGAAHYEILAGDAPVARLGADVRRHALVTPDLSHVAIRPVDAQGRAGKALTAVETRAVLKVLGAGSGRPVANLLGAGADPRGVDAALGGAGGLGVAGTGAGGGGQGMGLGGLGSIPGAARRPADASAVVTVGEAVITGDLDARIVKRVLRRQWPQLRHCTRGVTVEPTDLTATLSVQSGRVVAVQLGGPERAAPITQCFTQVLQRARFPARPQPAEIRVPIAVKPRS